MSDDLTPETEAEIEKAMSNGLMPDHETLHALELLMRAFEAVGALEMQREWVTKLPEKLLSDTVVPDEWGDTDFDAVRSWLVEAGDALQEFLHVHGLPYLQLPYVLLSCGCVRMLRLDVDR